MFFFYLERLFIQNKELNGLFEKESVQEKPSFIKKKRLTSKVLVHGLLINKTTYMRNGKQLV